MPEVNAEPGAPSPNWQRTLWSVLFIQSLMMAGTTILGPVVPALLPELGVTGDSGIRLWTGAILATTPLVAAFTSPIWGRLAQRIGCKRVIAASAFAVSITALLMWFATSPLQLLLLRVFMGSFSGFSAAGLTLVSTAAPRERLGYTLGWLSAGQIIGTLTGPVFGGIIADVTHSVRSPFALTVFVAVLAGTLALLVLPKESAPQNRSGTGDKANLVDLFSASPMIAALFVIILLATCGLRSSEPLIVLQTQYLLGVDHGQVATLAGFAVAASGIGNMLVAPFFGRRSDVIGYRRTVLIGLLGASAMALPQAFAGNYTLFLVARLFFGMFVGGVLSPLQVLVARASPTHLRGAVFGISASAGFLGGSIGPMAGGAVSAYFGLSAGFCLAAAILFTCFLAVPFVVPKDEGPAAAP